MTLIDIESNLRNVKKRLVSACERVGRLPQEVTLIAVTKTVETPAIEAASKLGICNFGENRVQEAEKKVRSLSYLQPKPTWHMIGHLQSNKINSALELFDVIQSVDSIVLAKSISQRALRKVSILLQVNVAGELTKSGFSLSEITPAFLAISQLPNVEVRGLMTIAPLASDPEQVRPVFRKLKELRDSFHLEHLSMGMTDDFEVAIEEGATLIRIGRAIFGERG